MKNLTKVLLGCTLGLGTLVGVNVSYTNKSKIKVNKENIIRLSETLSKFINNNKEMLDNHGIVSLPIFYNTDIMKISDEYHFSTTINKIYLKDNNIIDSNIDSLIDKDSENIIIYHLPNILQTSKTFRLAEYNLIMMYIADCLINSIKLNNDINNDFIHTACCKQAKIIYTEIIKHNRG